MKTRRHNADDGVRSQIEQDGFTNRVRITVELFLPQLVAQHDDLIFSVLLFFGQKRSTEKRLRSHHLEKIVADQCATDARRLCGSGDEWSPAIECRDAVEESLLRAIVDDVGV